MAIWNRPDLTGRAAPTRCRSAADPAFGDRAKGGHTGLVGEARKSRRTVLLGVEDLTEAEKRSRRSMLRLIVYAYGAILVFGIVLFSREWWEILILWYVVGFGCLVWYFTYIRRARRQRSAG